MRVLKKDELAFVAGGLFGEGGRGGHGGNGGAGGEIINAASGGLARALRGDKAMPMSISRTPGPAPPLTLAAATAAPAARAAPVREPYELKGMPAPVNGVGLPS